MNIDFDDFLEYLYVTGQLDEDEEKEDEDDNQDDYQKQIKK